MADATRDLEKAQEAYDKGDVEASIKAHDAKLAEGHSEDHKKSGEHIKSIIFGGMDGIITTFAVVSGATGGGLGIDVILILGFSNIIADALSMGVGDALSTKAENEFVMKERQREAWELENHPEGEKAEMYAIFEEKGLSKEDSKQIIDIMAKYPEFFVDAMMHYELEVEVPGEDDNPWIDGGITFLSFVIFGVVPLLGYLIFYSVPGLGSQELFVIACCLTAITLFVLGAIKTKVTAQKWWLGGLEIFALGSLTACCAYLIGWGVESAILSGEGGVPVR
eukprot:INCI19109.1.p1 GENE.INCI19109.1~~INCI19109.1.p1  ORF type:complete len:280 (-),score=47.31 INCI19109.1:158-997(-)